MRHAKTPIHLTPRQHEIAQLIWAGQTGPQIAARLAISPRTVDVHRTMLHAKYRTTNLAQLLKALLRDGVLSHGGTTPC